MSTDESAKLETLLSYWIEHNREHSQEFREWANKAKGFGQAEVSNEILAAVTEMDKASALLYRAWSRLKEREG